MVKNILIVNGAIRVNGNTDILVNKVIEGARNAETDITVFNLREKKDLRLQGLLSMPGRIDMLFSG